MTPLFCFKTSAVIAFAFLIGVKPGTAQPLTHLWESALKTAPSLQAAQAQLRATLERENQAFAQFLPQLNFSANTTQNNRDYQQLGLFPSSDKDRYNSHGAQLNLTQPLWKKANSAAYNQAKINTRQAHLQYLTNEQELMSKLVASWAELLYAKSAWISASTAQAAAQEQLRIFESGFTRGLHSQGQRDESRAKQALALADQISAENDIFARQVMLEQITGPLPAFNARLIQNSANALPFAELFPFDYYADRIKSANPAVLASQLAVESARSELDKISAQRFGSLDLVATAGHNAQPKTGATPSQSGFKSRQQSIALQFNLPLYSGGGQTAKERESAALVEKAQAELNSVVFDIIGQASQAWAQVRASYSKATAAQQALLAADTLLATARAGQNSGTRIRSDELHADQQRANAQREVHRAYYDNIIGMSRLLASVGALNEDFLAQLEQKHQAPKLPSPLPDLPLRLKMSLMLR